MFSAIAVAQRFLDLASNEGRRLSNMQLQKLVFFAHGTHLAAFNEPLIDESAMAWNFGPVIPGLYERLRRYGSGYVDPVIDQHERDKLENSPLASRADKAITATWDAYRKHNAFELSQISHLPGTPWDTIWNKEKKKFAVIPNPVIKQYYEKLVDRNARR